MTQNRKIIHIDMDAFYAAVEQRDNPDLRGKPVVVGGNPHSRGVVSTCSYEARKFGIHSAMPARQAYKLCPHAIFVRPRFSAYKEVSRQIRDIFHEYTDLVEPLSLDEAFLDVTDNKKGIASATRIACDIKNRICRVTGLTASAGVSYNKFLAKVASDMNKPNGLTVVPPGQGEQFVAVLPIRKFFGVGAVTEQKMLSLGIKTGGDLRKWTEEELTRHFGKAGAHYYNIARGLDERPVEPSRIRKSLGKEVTLGQDIDDIRQMLEILEKLTERVAEQLQRYGEKGCTITVKVKYHDFRLVTRSVSLQHPVNSAQEIMEEVPGLLRKTDAGRTKVRLLGVSISNFREPETALIDAVQLELPFP
jgi:DNA polymerase-4